MAFLHETTPSDFPDHGSDEAPLVDPSGMGARLAIHGGERFLGEIHAEIQDRAFRTKMIRAIGGTFAGLTALYLFGNVFVYMNDARTKTQAQANAQACLRTAREGIPLENSRIVGPKTEAQCQMALDAANSTLVVYRPVAEAQALASNIRQLVEQLPTIGQL
jgi:hypothetical protein